jgi:large subunit ribosomal protein L17
MKHRVGFNRLGRKPAHRKALRRNMVTSLFKHERIRTTKAKAREIRRTAEKMITRAKVDSVHNRRMVGRDIKDKAVLAKLFVDIAPRFKTRPGGYTRMLRIGQRRGDASDMVLLELVHEEVEHAPKSKKKGAEKSEKKAATAEAPAKSEKPEAASQESDQTAEEQAEEATAEDASAGEQESAATDEEKGTE